MKTYTIYSKENASLEEGIQYIREGFNWKAAVFNILWLLYNRLWLMAFVYYFTIHMILELNQSYILSSGAALLSMLLVAVMLGFSANDLIINRFVKRGYRLTDIIIAKSLDEAQFKFIKRVHKNLLTNESGSQ